LKFNQHWVEYIDVMSRISGAPGAHFTSVFVQ
jgi:hypothetical protein